MSEEGKESLAICQGIEARRVFGTNMKKMFEKGTLDGVQGGAGYFLLPMFTKEKVVSSWVHFGISAQIHRLEIAQRLSRNNSNFFLSLSE